MHSGRQADVLGVIPRKVHDGLIPARAAAVLETHLEAIGGVKAAFKGFVKGEISDLTTPIYDARENVFDRLQSDAAAVDAEEVVGVKTYIVELGSDLNRR